MTAFIVSIASVVCFAVGLVRLRILILARKIASISAEGTTSLLDPSLDDDAKETAVKRAGFELLKSTGGLALRFALVLAAAFLPLLLADIFQIVPVSETLALMLRLDYIVGVTLACMVLAYALRRIRRPSEADQAVGGYQAGDRLIHAIAFASPAVMRGLAGAEDSLYSRRLAQVRTRPPVFITSLARGGTTALLNALHDVPDLATHEFRDMPFITAPLIWSRLSGSRRVPLAERAHGDGIKIDLSSPEAFDEVLWRLQWPQKYSESWIELWNTADYDPSSAAFLTRHFNKIALLRRGANAGSGTLRYLSKNNANIARLAVLPVMFPGADIIVPLREPTAHAASLFRQHENFKDRQIEDAFVGRYMRDIGHFEFGELHCPIGFNGFDPDAFDAATPDYWLAYWIAAFEEVAAHSEICHFVTQDAMRNHPQETITELCDRLGVGNGNLDFRKYFRSERDQERSDLFCPELVKRATEIYASLVK